MKMKKVMMALGAVMLLAGCGDVGSQVNTAGGKAVVSANDLYTAASRAGEDLVKLGVLDKDVYKARDAQAYDVLVKVRNGTATVVQLQAAVNLITAK